MIPVQRAFIIFSLSLGCAAVGTSAFAGGKVRRNVEIEWEPVDGASQYEVQVTRKDERGKKPTLIKTHEPKWAATIKPGLYLMQIRSYDDRGVPGEWSPPSDLRVKLPSVVQNSPAPGAVLKGKDENNQEIPLHWEAVPGADHYKISVHSTTSTWQTDKEVEGLSWDAKVPVGESLEWNVTAMDRKGEMGEANETPQTFSVAGPALPKPLVDRPLSKYVREITWTAPANAKKYAYDISYRNPKTKKWEKLESKTDVTETKAPLDISRPSGRYRIKVKAFADRRDPSVTSVMDFETYGGFRDPAALETAIVRDSIVKPTNYYTILSYFITDIAYQADNFDTNYHPRFAATGGTGRVGMGYQDHDSPWGGFGIADLSGFVIEGQKYTFASAEAHLTRKVEFGQRGIFLAGTGLYMKELPVVNGNPGNFTGIGKVRQIGPHAGFTYWLPFNQRWGMQFNGRLYYSLTGSADNGGKIQPAASYQYGLLGSYRVGLNWMGYFGYAFRKDLAEYGAATGPQNYAKPGETDSIEIQGHYLNLQLEWGF